MILAAGRGERMRPLTEHTPKPLLKVGGKSLIEYHLQRLAAAGVREAVINVSYLGEKICATLGDVFFGEQNHQQITIHYSFEPEPLETAGAILHAMPLLGDQPFLLINGDIWTDYPFKNLLSKKLKNTLGHIVLVDNPAHHSEGDFLLDVGSDPSMCFLIDKDESAENETQAYTFSGVSLLDPKFIANYTHCRTHFPLVEVLRYWASRKKVTAETYAGDWRDIGTIERLQELDEILKAAS